MEPRIKFMLVLTLLLTAAILSGCEGQKPVAPAPGIDAPVNVDDTLVTVLAAGIRNSYSVYYLMQYPPPGSSFYAVTVRLEGFDDPQSALAWGKENLRLVQADQEYELAYAHWELVGEEIQYKSAQEFQYRYVFLYTVPQGTEAAQVSLQVAGSDLISLSLFVKEPEKVGKQDNSGTVDGYDEGDLFATIAGGSKNTSSAFHTTVGGGHLNQALVAYATVGGGRENLAANYYSTVSGGYGNEAAGRDATVGGGSRNVASTYHATISGGIRNQASASDATIGGGGYNLASDTYATVGGGTQNEASGSGAVVSGGAGNLSSNNQTTVGGGLGNQANGPYATVSGGQGNLASGMYSAVPGGLQNQAQGAYSFAGGHRASVYADHPGVFLFADSLDTLFRSEGANEFGVRATGGVRFVTAVDQAGVPSAGVVLPPGSGSWSSLSDRGRKENFRGVDQVQILEAVVALPVSEWNYKSQDASIRHIGPMSQDFYAAFGTGEDESHISSIDADGVSLAAIQGLYQLVEEQDARIRSLESRLRTLETITISALCMLGLTRLRSVVASLRSRE